MEKVYVGLIKQDLGEYVPVIRLYETMAFIEDKIAEVPPVMLVGELKGVGMHGRYLLNEWNVDQTNYGKTEVYIYISLEEEVVKAELEKEKQWRIKELQEAVNEIQNIPIVTLK